MEGNLHFKIDWASLIVCRKFTVFVLFYFVFEGNFQVLAPGDLYLEGRFNGGFFALQVWWGFYLEGLICFGFWISHCGLLISATGFLIVCFHMTSWRPYLCPKQ